MYLGPKTFPSNHELYSQYSLRKQVLESLDVPSNQKHNACLEWMMIRANQGMDDGTLRKSDALEQRLLDQMCQLRGTYATIGDRLSCRMPLPYTHFVQVLVDTFIALSPFALYADLGIYSVFGCGKCFCGARDEGIK